MKCLVFVGVLVPLALLAGRAAAQGAWSDWRPAQGSQLNVEYRWRLKTCLPVACFKDVEFRNDAKQSVTFDYTIWSEGLLDAGEEVKDSGSDSLMGESSNTVQASTGGQKVTRVFTYQKKN
jgi:hypothetical protein